jgi:hypothetical protein
MKARRKNFIYICLLSYHKRCHSLLKDKKRFLMKVPFQGSKRYDIPKNPIVSFFWKR